MTKDELILENERLRAAIANSASPCIYCSLPAEDIGKCKKGFPGCGRADDMMGCPELGASLTLEDFKNDLVRLMEKYFPGEF